MRGIVVFWLKSMPFVDSDVGRSLQPKNVAVKQLGWNYWHSWRHQESTSVRDVCCAVSGILKPMTLWLRRIRCMFSGVGSLHYAFNLCKAFTGLAMLGPPHSDQPHGLPSTFQVATSDSSDLSDSWWRVFWKFTQKASSWYCRLQLLLHPQAYQHTLTGRTDHWNGIVTGTNLLSNLHTRTQQTCSEEYRTCSGSQLGFLGLICSHMANVAFISLITVIFVPGKKMQKEYINDAFVWFSDIDHIALANSAFMHPFEIWLDHARSVFLCCPEILQWFVCVCSFMPPDGTAFPLMAYVILRLFGHRQRISVDALWASPSSSEDQMFTIHRYRGRPSFTVGLARQLQYQSTGTLLPYPHQDLLYNTTEPRVTKAVPYGCLANTVYPGIKTLGHLNILRS